jgi:regulator of cell morphogenesis and NO signaling
MSTATTLPPLTAESTLGEIVRLRPGLARVFERLGLDYCCGGKQTLAKACSRTALDPHTVITLLEAAATSLTAPDEVDAASLTLTELANHIEQTHHRYVKAELPRLLEMAERVARKHGERDPRLEAVRDTVAELTAEMLQHMEKEEVILFPLVRQIEGGAADTFHCGSIANPIRQMEVEHEHAGQALARLRELTDGFTPDENACNTHRALLAGLAQFEEDLHRHVHKENNILFPRAIERAERN